MATPLMILVLVVWLIFSQYIILGSTASYREGIVLASLSQHFVKEPHKLDLNPSKAAFLASKDLKVM